MLDLWNLTKVDGIQDNSDAALEIKQVARLVKSHLTKRFKSIKFSIKSSAYSESIYISIKSSPFKEDSEEIKAVIEYAKAYAASYEYPYTFTYLSCRTDYSYIQTEPDKETERLFKEKIGRASCRERV